MKRLFFSALVAIVAVGGALTANAIIYTQSGTALNCAAPPSPTCATHYGLPSNTPVYDKPASDPTRKVIGTIADFSYQP